MSEQFASSIKIRNDEAGFLSLWVEPWAEEFKIGPNSELEVEFSGPQAGQLSVNYSCTGLAVYGFNGSIAKVIKDGTLVWVAHERLML